MHLTKKTSYTISALIVVSFFGMGALFLGFQDTPEKNPRSASVESVDTPVEISENPTTLPDDNSTQIEPAQVDGTQVDANTTKEGFALKDFHRSEMRDGKLLWEIVGTNARYFPEEKRVDVEKCVFSTIDKKNTQIILHAGKAKLYLNGPELKSVYFSADVTLDYGKKLKIITPEATYEHKEGYVTSSAHVKVVSSWYMIEGDGLKAHLNDKHYKILKNVSSVIEPKKRKAQQKSS